MIDTAPRSSMAARYALLGYCVVLGATAAIRVWLMVPRAFDLGFMSAGLGALARDGVLGVVPWAGQIFIADHFSPALLALAPIGRSPWAGMALVVIQAAAVTATVWVVHRHLLSVGTEPWLRRLATSAAALHPALLYGALFDAHANVLGLPLIALFFSATRLDRRDVALVSGLLAAAFREDLALVVVVVALANHERLGRWRATGLAATGIAALVTWLSLATGIGASSLFGYVDLGDIPGTVARALSLTFESGHVWSLTIVLALPWLLLGSYDWRVLLPVLVVHAPLLAAETPVTRVLAFHYWVMIPVVFAVALRPREPASGGPLSSTRRRAWGWIVVAAWLALGPFGVSALAREYTQNSVPALLAADPEHRASQVRQALDCIPSAAGLAVDGEVTPWIADRSDVWLLPHPFEDLMFATGSGPRVLRRALPERPDAVISTNPPSEVRDTFIRDPAVPIVWWRASVASCGQG